MGACCAPVVRCGTPRIEKMRRCTIPKENIKINTNITNLTRYIAGVDPLKQQCERGPIVGNLVVSLAVVIESRMADTVLVAVS